MKKKNSGSHLFVLNATRANVLQSQNRMKFSSCPYFEQICWTSTSVQSAGMFWTIIISSHLISLFYGPSSFFCQNQQAVRLFWCESSNDHYRRAAPHQLYTFYCLHFVYSRIRENKCTASSRFTVSDTLTDLLFDFPIRAENALSLSSQNVKRKSWWHVCNGVDRLGYKHYLLNISGIHGEQINENWPRRGH